MLSKETLKLLGKIATKNLPSILTVSGVFGMGASIVKGVKAGMDIPKKMVITQDEILKKNPGRVHEFYADNIPYHTAVYMTKSEKVKVIAKETWPIAVGFVGSSICIFAANSVNLRRSAALAAAYSLSEKSLRNYEEQVFKEFGEKGHKKIKDRIAKQAVKDNPPDSSNVIITGKGDYMCLDSVSGRYFKSNIEEVRKAVNRFNTTLLKESVLSLNDFYDELGIPHIDIGYNVGWFIDKMDDLLEISYTTALTESEEPCLVLNYRCQPTWDFRDY